MRALGIAMIVFGTMGIQSSNNKVVKALGVIVVVSGVYVQNWELWYHV